MILLTAAVSTTVIVTIITAILVHKQPQLRIFHSAEPSERCQTRKRALLELVTTERNYVQYLSTLYDYYYLPMILQNYSYVTLLNDVAFDFKKYQFLEERENIFHGMIPPDLPCVLRLNYLLLQELEMYVLGMHSTMDMLRKWTCGLFGKYGTDRYAVCCVNKGANVGKIFRKYAPAFRLYSEYVGYLKSSRHKLEAFASKNSDFKNFITSTAIRLVGNDLKSIMSMPFQRIARYPMLLKVILENTSSSSESFTDLELSLKLMQQVTDFINERTGDIEQRLKVISIQEELQKEYPKLQLVIPSRTYFIEENIQNMDSQHYKLILFNDLLLMKRTKKASALKSILGFFKNTGADMYICELHNVELKKSEGSNKVTLSLNDCHCYLDDKSETITFKTLVLEYKDSIASFMQRFEQLIQSKAKKSTV
jgi:hypothetical protein